MRFRDFSRENGDASNYGILRRTARIPLRSRLSYGAYVNQSLVESAASFEICLLSRFDSSLPLSLSLIGSLTSAPNITNTATDGFVF